MGRFRLDTDHPLAVDSPDFKHAAQPGVRDGGPVIDNSKWPAFNKKLYALFPEQQISVLDLGCSGGGFVEDCVNDGHLAVGLEGSDYSLRHKRDAWATIPGNLFTCDCTKPFTVLWEFYEGGGCRPWYFDVVTAWEFMEHIAEPELPQLCENVRRHLKRTGLWVMSVSECPGPPFHQTIRPRDWWLSLFDREGFAPREDLVPYFGDDWIRGPKQKAEGSFHVVLSRKP